MTAQKIFNDMIKIEEVKGSITLGLGSFQPDADNPEYRSLNVSDELAKEFLAIVNKLIASLSNKNKKKDLTLCEYDAGYKPESYEVEWVDFNDVNYLSNLLSDLPEPVGIPLFNKNEKEFFNHLRFYVLIIQPEKGNPIYFFRSYSKKKELSYGSKIVAIMVGNRFNTLEQPGFLFDHKIDCIACSNYVFSFNKHNFQTIFRFYEQLKETAQQSLDTIQSHIPISNFFEFSTACMSHLQKLAKLRNIANKPYLPNITMEDIKRTITRNKLNVEIVKNENGEEKIKFDPKDKWVILNILDDAYLESEMTHLNYEVNSKKLLE